ncbi:protein O-GlcNAc transferase [Candidatus Magnetomoraceae bacterium gMMP-1]
MISIIVCSNQNPCSAAHRKNIEKTVGCEFEYIRINNSDNKFGICAAYNKGTEKASGDILVFVHDDVFFISSDWGKILQEKFSFDSSLGLVGLAGTQYLDKNNPFWPYAERPFIYGRVVHEKKDPDKSVLTIFSRDKRDTEVVAVDGLFLAIKKSLFNTIKFDEKTFDRFHFYDLDISMQVKKTHKVIVTCDILVKHLSGGSFKGVWKEYAKRFIKKYWNALPASCTEKSFCEKNLSHFEAFPLEEVFSSEDCNHIKNLGKEFVQNSYSSHPCKQSKSNNSLAIALQHHKSGKLKEAEALYHSILKDNPDNADNADVWHLLGLISYQRDENNLAENYFKKAININPYEPNYYKYLALIYKKQNKLEHACKAYLKALSLKPDDAEIHYNAGIAFQESGKIDESCKHYEQALKIKPDFIEAYNNLSVALKQNGQLYKAIDCCNKLLKFKPDDAKALNNLGVVFRQLGEINKAAAYYKKALLMNPDYVEAQSNLLFCLNYSPDAISSIFDEYRRWGKKYAYLSKTYLFHSNLADSERPLRVGYVSPDFRSHPVAYFFEPVLANHDPKQIETVCYAEVSRPDTVTNRLKSLSKQWRNTCALTDLELADMIRSDGIDILIDLAGHTSDNRLLVFAAKPAPIQVSYLGYPNTTGLYAIDYRITDSYADPLGKTEKYHTEKLVRLPHSFFCYKPPDENIEVSSLPALKKNHISFGAFYNFAKISSNIKKLWLKILKAIPDSEFIIQSLPFADEKVCKQMLDFFTQNGISQKRIQLIAFSPVQDYLKLHNSVDIILDTFPWNGHTTSCHALWMGVPIITLVGEHHASRLGASLLSCLGLSEWIACAPDEYVQKAVNLAGNFDRLAYIRHNLRNHILSSPLCDGEKFTRSLETAYREMWQKWCSGQS